MTSGVLLTAFGTADGPDDVPRFLASMGRPATPEAVADLQRRYRAVGGRTPFRAITEAQASRLGRELGPGWRVQAGFKHAEPRIADAARALVETGVERAVVLPLAVHDSGKSVGGYLAAAREAFAALPRAGAPAPPLRVGEVRGFATHPLLLAFWADRVREALARDPGAVVLFTAHSLPLRLVQGGDPYEAQVRATCEGVAREAGLPARGWRQCWQSAAGEAWLAPDILQALEQAAKQGARGVVVAPVGFVGDHLETLYDLDVEARQRAEALGLAWQRCAPPNDDPRFIALLADLARRALPA